jgi:hypothetical protein
VELGVRVRLGLGVKDILCYLSNFFYESIERWRIIYLLYIYIEKRVGKKGERVRGEREREIVVCVRGSEERMKEAG